MEALGKGAFEEGSRNLVASRVEFKAELTRGADLVALFRHNNSLYNNYVGFSSPTVAPEQPPLQVEVHQPSETKSPHMSHGSKGKHARMESIIKPISLSINGDRAPDEGCENLFDVWLWHVLYRWWSEGYLKAVLFWVIWMATGTAFYAVHDKLGWDKGFYMMVNVGYSIGSGYPKELNNNSLWFSIMNVLVGAIALGCALNAFAQSLLHISKPWYEVAEYERAMADASLPWFTKKSLWMEANGKKLYVILGFLGWGSLMVFWAASTVSEWKFVECMYFAVSHLSTGGLYPLPRDVAGYNYVIAGLFICFGVPLMCLAMGNVAALLLPFSDPEKDRRIIDGKVTREEVQMMKEFGLSDDAGSIDRAGFILLCSVRLGAATPDLINEIKKRFVTLDSGRRGHLTRDEILQEHHKNILILGLKKLYKNPTNKVNEDHSTKAPSDENWGFEDINS